MRCARSITAQSLDGIQVLSTMSQGDGLHGTGEMRWNASIVWLI